MSANTVFIAGLLVLAVSHAGCDAGPGVGSAEEPWCRGYYVNQVKARDGAVFFISPDHLASATEAWGPQTLSLSVEQEFSPEISLEQAPSLSRERDKITQSLQASVGFSLTKSTNLVASSAVLVPADAYYRLEAYPQYQVVDFHVRRDPCGPMGDALLTTGSVYRPVGIYFRVMVYVGAEWNALSAPSPSQIPVPPSLTRVPEADAGTGQIPVPPWLTGASSADAGR